MLKSVKPLALVLYLVFALLVAVSLYARSADGVHRDPVGDSGDPIGGLWQAPAAVDEPPPVEPEPVGDLWQVAD